jgi:Nif-specific regulatory protein
LQSPPPRVFSARGGVEQRETEGTAQKARQHQKPKTQKPKNPKTNTKNPKPNNTMPKEPQSLRELSLLFDISQELDRSLDLKKVLATVVEQLVERTEMTRAALTLLNRETQEIVTEESYGLSPSEQTRGRFRIGEGVTGQVVETGAPAIVERIADSEAFLNRTGPESRARAQDVSYLCVPILQETEVIGTLSVDRPIAPREALEKSARLLSIVASMIAQAVRLRQAAEEERQSLIEENTLLQRRLRERFQPENIIGTSKKMLDVFNMIRQVAESHTTVLILGESGTGKELIANALHHNSERGAKPFIKVNCGALPENLIESELFGHEKGAFTGAVKTRKGRFELADTGTIFLDEVGELSPSMQVKLLRVLQEHTFERVGGTETIEVDVRIVAATSRDLEQRIEEDQFRQDLYYRLNVFPIHVPPLRERKSDIMLLADHFVEKYSSVHDEEVQRISTPAIDMLIAYHWPGNVRELENCVERAVLMSTDGVIHGHHLPPSLQTAEATGTGFKGNLDTALDSLERELVLDALKSTRGNRAAAARQLGITERIIGLRVDKYGIDTSRFK